jgi:hypothetical protein
MEILMTLTNVLAAITARGYSVTASDTVGRIALTVKTAQGSTVAWPDVTIGKNGNVSDVALPSFHGGKVTGLGDYPTAAIYGDVYLRYAGHPAQAEKAIAALLVIGENKVETRKAA